MLLRSSIMALCNRKRTKMYEKRNFTQTLTNYDNQLKLENLGVITYGELILTMSFERTNLNKRCLQKSLHIFD